MHLHPPVPKTPYLGVHGTGSSSIDRAFALFPLNYAIWFTRFYFLLYGGHATEAIAMIADVGSRPPGIPASSFDQILLCAKAIQSGEKADIDLALTIMKTDMRSSAGVAENAIEFASAAGRIDEAFAVANAYFFGRPETVGELRFSIEQGTYTRRNDRRTWMLFLPPTSRMRADARFEKLMGDIGLARYWSATGSVPDYCRRLV